MISFETYWFFVLTPLPWFIYRWLPAISDQSPALKVPFIADLESVAAVSKQSRVSSYPYIILLSIMWLLLLLAVNRPIAIGEAIKLPTEARDMILAVDISGSMEEKDMVINGRNVRRIDTVKYVLGEFADRRIGDRLGLILFADQAYLQVPLTYDTQTVKQLLIEAQLGFAGQKTAIGDAIGLSIKRLAERPAESRTLILLTDGANNAGSVQPLDAAKLAAENDITIHTVAVGADRMIEQSFLGQRIRNPSRDLDENTLKRISSQTGGKFFRAKDTEGLESIYEELDKLEPVDQEARFYRPTQQLFYIPLSAALAIGLLILLVKLLTRLIQKISRNQQSHDRNNSI